MNHISIVWDVLFTGKAVTEKGSTDIMLMSMSEHIQFPIDEVMNWNTLHKGQKVSRAGYTSGLRFILDVTNLDILEISKLERLAISFEHKLSNLSSVSLAEKLHIPLNPQAKIRFPELGRIMLCVKFTDGLGYSDAKQIRNAIGTQTKETKDGLDPTGIGKGSSGICFNDEFRSILSDANWFRRFPSNFGAPKGLLTKAASGGCYDLSYDLRKGVRNLTDSSEGIWWSKLDPDELTLSPSLIVDPSELNLSGFDPSNFHHLMENKSKKLVAKSLEIEMEQTANDSLINDLKYNFDRIKRGRRIRKQIGVSHGLAHGNEKFVISNYVIRPWFAEEFINCLAFFLMTRKPKYWRNGQSELCIVQPFSLELIEALKEAE